MEGFDILGVDGPTGAQVQQALQSMDERMKSLQPAQQKMDLKDPQFQRAMNAATYMMVGSAVGAVVGGVGLAALWTTHRVLGFFLGFLLVGPSAGAGVGFAIGQAKAVK